MNSTFKAGLILAVIFALGILAGIAGQRLLDPRPPYSHGNDPFRMEKGVIERIEKRLVGHYGLSDKQAESVRAILLESQLKYDAFFHETRPTFERIRREQRDAIRAIMTPEQVVKFDKWLEERHYRIVKHVRIEPPKDGGPNADRRFHGPPPSHEAQPPAKD